MAELIAQGPDPVQRWRRPLPMDEPFALGRDAGPWSVPWDDRISRKHVELCWRRGRLEIKKEPKALNPVFCKGEEVENCSLKPGDRFLIGETTFSVVDDQVHFALDLANPVREQTFAPQELRRVKFRNPDQRIEVLSRLPEVISGAANDFELFSRLVNVLLAGLPRASAALIVAMERIDGQSRLQVLHWDRRLAKSEQFKPSQRLVEEALSRAQSVVHVWEQERSVAASPSAFTMMEDVDWAFCTPVLGAASAGWGIYVAGRFSIEGGKTPSASDPTDLREDLKFTELVAATLSSLRQLHSLERKQAALGRFFAPTVLEALAQQDPDRVLAPRETHVSVLFGDLRGFSLASEKNAGDLLGLLNRVSGALGVMTHHILNQRGVFGDFQGDAAMGFWGWPLAMNNDIERACLAALAIRLEFESAVNTPGHPYADFRVGIGLASGTAVAGRIGTKDQVKVTVFGPVVNLASRLEGMTKILHTPILLDEPTAAFVKKSVSPLVARCRRLARVKPYGMDTPIEVAELLPPVEAFPELDDAAISNYESALDAFLAGHWKEANQLLHLVPASDPVKDFLTVFIAQHNRVPPPDWNGVIPLTSKG